MKVKIKDNSFKLSIFSLFMVEGIYQVQHLFNQILAARVSVEVLTAFSMLSFLMIYFSVFGLALGETSLLVVNRSSRIRDLRKYFGGALYIYSILSLIGFLLLLLFKDSVVSLLLLQNLPNLEAQYIIWILNSFFIGWGMVIFHFLFAMDEKKKTFILNGSAFLSNILLVIPCMFLFKDQNSKFLAISIAFLISNFVGCCVGTYSIRKHLRFKWRDIGEFYKRCSSVFFGDFIAASALFVAPLCYSIILGHVVGGESIAAFNTAIRIYEVLFLLFWAIQFPGIAWLHNLWEFRGEPEWFDCLRSLRNTSILVVGVPTALFVILIPILYPTLFNLKSDTAWIIGVATISSLIPHILTVDTICKVRAFEKQHVRSVINFVTTYFVGMALMYYFGSKSMIAYCAVFGLVAPSLIQCLSLIVYSKVQKMDAIPKAADKLHQPQ